MKKISLFLFLLLSIIKVSACKCVTETLAKNYLDADVVGVIKILKVYGENTAQRTYKADVEFEKAYKGTTFKTLNVRGLIGRSSSAACEIDVEPNDRYLIFLNKSGNGYSISSCTPRSRLKKAHTKNESSQLETLSEVFSYLDKNKDKLKGLQFASYYDDSQSSGKSGLSKISGFKPKQPFAIYKVKINGLSRIKEMTPVISFGSKDKTIETALRRQIAVSAPIVSGNSVQKEFLLLLFYHKENIKAQDKEMISNSW
ncbi:hypothetical protein LF887_18330 [Chryseobacterium sp. MEBOG06]|uniref:hypothetical protein n=1 Tax=unclassified Chryseobacterium TaxID=2593645 RepID=UPI001F1A512B|nr:MULTISPECIES: hypothetical protein [unclassified Chryseobacterium]UKB82952.1 hypothetical protein LF887_18330 [Chryseobacterium sp. MEBOG06]